MFDKPTIHNSGKLQVGAEYIFKKIEIPEGDYYGENGENEDEEQGGIPDGQHVQWGRNPFYDEMPAFFLCADSGAIAIACLAAVPVQSAGECSEYWHHCDLHSGYFFGRPYCGEKGGKPEIFVGALDGRDVFCGAGIGFIGGKQEHCRCGDEFCHCFCPVRRKRDAGRHGF